MIPSLKAGGRSTEDPKQKKQNARMKDPKPKSETRICRIIQGSGVSCRSSARPYCCRHPVMRVSILLNSYSRST